MPHKCKRNLLGLLVWINKVDPFFFVHLFSTTVATVPAAAAAAAAVAAFFSHRAIIDVYFHWNKEGIVDGISSDRERKISFYYRLLLLPFPLFFFFLSSLSIFAIFDRRAALNHGLYARGPR